MITNKAKLLLWFQRYKVTAAAYLARLTQKGISPKGAMKTALTQLTTALATPGSFVATNNNPVSFSWAAVTGATGYVLQSATNAGFTTGVTTIYTGSAVAFTSAIAQLTTGQSKYFRVKATAADAADSAWATASIIVP